MPTIPIFLDRVSEPPPGLRRVLLRHNVRSALILDFPASASDVAIKEFLRTAYPSTSRSYAVHYLKFPESDFRVPTSTPHVVHDL